MKALILLTAALILALPARGVQAEMKDDHDHKGKMAVEERMKHAAAGSKYEEEEGLIDVGNKICPVSGEEIGSMGEGVDVEYNGKIYHLCCKMCEKDFKKNPEKYSAIAEAEAGHEDEGMAEEEEMHDHQDHDEE
ncbi:MAG: YHS domain-containing protein [Candidatus Omnitrophica bacterium]|nr:YHS domain-containing protein [Candidatus Omnitrophota bacterium]MCB9720152.1 YHS domain-containing protein [Candidatus Omnitrophota bacterium]